MALDPIVGYTEKEPGHPKGSPDVIESLLNLQSSERKYRKMCQSLVDDVGLLRSKIKKLQDRLLWAMTISMISTTVAIFAILLLFLRVA